MGEAPCEGGITEPRRESEQHSIRASISRAGVGIQFNKRWPLPTASIPLHEPLCSSYQCEQIPSRINFSSYAPVDGTPLTPYNSDSGVIEYI